MAGTGLRPFMLNFVMIILFTFLILGFVGYFLAETNPTSPVLDSKYGVSSAYDSMNSSLSEYRSFTDNLKTTLATSDPSPLQYMFLIARGLWDVALAFTVIPMDILISFFYTIFVFFKWNTFGGILGIVTSIISAGLVLTLVLYIIKFMRSGESER